MSVHREDIFDENDFYVVVKDVRINQKWPFYEIFLNHRCIEEVRSKYAIGFSVKVRRKNYNQNNWTLVCDKTMDNRGRAYPIQFIDGVIANIPSVKLGFSINGYYFVDHEIRDLLK